MTDRVFLSEVDVDILHMLARGADVRGIAARQGITEERVRERIFNMQSIFGAATRVHLIAIAIASSIVRVPDLFDGTLAESVWVKPHGKRRGKHVERPYNLASKRLEILESVVRP